MAQPDDDLLDFTSSPASCAASPISDDGDVSPPSVCDVVILSPRSQASITLHAADVATLGTLADVITAISAGFKLKTFRGLVQPLDMISDTVTSLPLSRSNCTVIICNTNQPFADRISRPKIQPPHTVTSKSRPLTIWDQDAMYAKIEDILQADYPDYDNITLAYSTPSVTYTLQLSWGAISSLKDMAGHAATRLSHWFEAQLYPEGRPPASLDGCQWRWYNASHTTETLVSYLFTVRNPGPLRHNHPLSSPVFQLSNVGVLYVVTRPI
jgi:hypothetical protein